MGRLHHLNVGCADASIITTDTATFLVDCHNIGDYSHLLPANKTIRGVFVTHQHRDHYSGLEYLRKNGYTIDTLIYSPYERRWDDNSVSVEEWNEFADHRDFFAKKGTTLYAPYRQATFNTEFWATNGARFWIIGPAQTIATSGTRELHDACLVITVWLGSRKCCFTGDASDANLEYIATNTNSYCDDILRASHHGSINGAHLDFIKGANAENTVISTAEGVHDSVPHPTALRRYAEHTKQTVYRTDKSGTISWDF